MHSFELFKRACAKPHDIFVRGNVLEPSGAVEIKFRKKDLVKTMRRLDSKYIEYSQALSSGKKITISLHRV